jgi:hypothetical protein
MQVLSQLLVDDFRFARIQADYDVSGGSGYQLVMLLLLSLHRQGPS